MPRFDKDQWDDGPPDILNASSERGGSDSSSEDVKKVFDAMLDQMTKVAAGSLDPASLNILRRQLRVQSMAQAPGPSGQSSSQSPSQSGKTASVAKNGIDFAGTSDAIGALQRKIGETNLNLMSLDRIASHNIDLKVAGIDGMADEVRDISDAIHGLSEKASSGVDFEFTGIERMKGELEEVDGEFDALRNSARRGVDIGVGHGELDVVSGLLDDVGKKVKDLSLSAGKFSINGLRDAEASIRSMKTLVSGLNVPRTPVGSISVNRSIEDIKRSVPHFASGGMIPETPTGKLITAGEAGTGGELLIPINKLLNSVRKDGVGVERKMAGDLSENRTRQEFLILKAQSEQLSAKEGRELERLTGEIGKQTVILSKIMEIDLLARSQANKAYNDTRQKMEEANADRKAQGKRVRYRSDVIERRSRSAAMKVYEKNAPGVTESAEQVGKIYKEQAKESRPVQGTAHIQAVSDASKGFIDALHRSMLAQGRANEVLQEIAKKSPLPDQDRDQLVASRREFARLDRLDELMKKDVSKQDQEKVNETYQAVFTQELLGGSTKLEAQTEALKASIKTLEAIMLEGGYDLKGALEAIADDAEEKARKTAAYRRTADLEEIGVPSSTNSMFGKDSRELSYALSSLKDAKKGRELSKAESDVFYQLKGQLAENEKMLSVFSSFDTKEKERVDAAREAAIDANRSKGVIGMQEAGRKASLDEISAIFKENSKLSPDAIKGLRSESRETAKAQEILRLSSLLNRKQRSSVESARTSKFQELIDAGKTEAQASKGANRAALDVLKTFSPEAEGSVKKAGDKGTRSASKKIASMGELKDIISKTSSETEKAARIEEILSKAFGKSDESVVGKSRSLLLSAVATGKLSSEEAKLVKEMLAEDAASQKLGGSVGLVSKATEVASKRMVSYAESMGLANSASGLMIAGSMLAFQQLTAIGTKIADTAVSVAKFRVAMGTANISAALDGTVESVEEVRNRLHLTREEAPAMFNIIREGAFSGVVSVNRLTEAAEKLRDTFGGFDEAKLRAYYELLKSMPNIEDVFSEGANGEKGASALAAIAKSGRGSDFMELRRAGLMGGPAGQQLDGANLLNAQQAARHHLQRIEESIHRHVPAIAVYASEIAKATSSTSRTLMQILALVGTMQALGAVRGAVGGGVPGISLAGSPIRGGWGIGSAGKLGAAGVGIGTGLMLASAGMDYMDYKRTASAHRSLALGDYDRARKEAESGKKWGMASGGAMALGGAAMAAGAIATIATGGLALLPIMALLAGGGAAIGGGMKLKDAASRDLSAFSGRDQGKTEHDKNAEKMIDSLTSRMFAELEDEDDIKKRAEIRKKYRGKISEEKDLRDFMNIIEGYQRRVESSQEKEQYRQLSSLGTAGFGTAAFAPSIANFEKAIQSTTKSLETLSSLHSLAADKMAKGALEIEDADKRLFALREAEIGIMQNFVSVMQQVLNLQKNILLSAPEVSRGTAASGYISSALTPGGQSLDKIAEMANSLLSEAMRSIPTAADFERAMSESIPGAISASATTRTMRYSYLEYMEEKGLLDTTGVRRGRGGAAEVTPELVEKLKGNEQAISIVGGKSFQYGSEKSGRKTYVGMEDLAKAAEVAGKSLESLGIAFDENVQYFVSTGRPGFTPDSQEELKFWEKKREDLIESGATEKSAVLEKMETLAETMGKRIGSEAFSARRELIEMVKENRAGLGEKENEQLLSRLEELDEQSTRQGPYKRLYKGLMNKDERGSIPRLIEGAYTDVDTEVASIDRIISNVKKEATMGKGIAEALSTGSEDFMTTLNQLKKNNIDSYTNKLQEVTRNMLDLFSAPSLKEYEAGISLTAKEATVSVQAIGSGEGEAAGALSSLTGEVIAYNTKMAESFAVKAGLLRRASRALEERSVEEAAKGNEILADKLKSQSVQAGMKAAEMMKQSARMIEVASNAFEQTTSALSKAERFQTMKTARAYERRGSARESLAMYSEDTIGMGRRAGEDIRRSAQAVYKERRGVIEANYEEQMAKLANETDPDKRARREEEIEANRSAALAQEELTLKKQVVRAAEAELNEVNRAVSARQALIDTEISFYSDIGASYATILNMQTQSLALQRRSIEEAKKAVENMGLTGEAKEQRLLDIQKMEVQYARQVVGMQRSAFDNLLGTAMGGIRSSFGARRQRMSAASILGINQTRFVTAAGVYGRSEPGVATRAEERAIRLQLGDEWGALSRRSPGGYGGMMGRNPVESGIENRGADRGLSRTANIDANTSSPDRYNRENEYSGATYDKSRQGSAAYEAVGESTTGKEASKTLDRIDISGEINVSFNTRMFETEVKRLVARAISGDTDTKSALDNYMNGKKTVTQG